ncbi:hypothetical protein EMIHUDRAFT_449414, partial [Emiliania huxleyi CCMP1516]|uniref:TFIIS N-terminal domain-containing protein n=2 Tax=Emiliania huxleyi TaxID=2903 RepID=A0A0D3KBJ7_EMIH1
MASLRAEPCEAPTVRAQRLHRTLQDAISEEEGAAAELERAEAVLRRAAARAKASRTALAERLDELASRPLTVTVLEKTLIGVTVNALRKHATPAIAAKSERLVRGWKTLALADRVLDEVRDEDGRVERRRAHPDSLEDALALREAREAERMWEERMGGGGSGGGGGGGGGGRGDGRDEAARRAAAERLRERYRSIEEAKRSREIVVEGGPARPGKQPRTAAGGRPNLVQHKRAAGGGGPLAA